MSWNGRHRLHDLKYTHYIKHRSMEPMRRKDAIAALHGASCHCTPGRVNTYIAANVRKSDTHITYDSENAWGQVITTRVPLGCVISIEEIPEGADV